MSKFLAAQVLRALVVNPILALSASGWNRLLVGSFFVCSGAGFPAERQGYSRQLIARLTASVSPGLGGVTPKEPTLPVNQVRFVTATAAVMRYLLASTCTILDF